MSERTCAASYFNPRTEDSTSGPLVRNLKVKQRTRRTKKNHRILTQRRPACLKRAETRGGTVK